VFEFLHNDQIAAADLRGGSGAFLLHEDIHIYPGKNEHARVEGPEYDFVNQAHSLIIKIASQGVPGQLVKS
jgi:hypothetical protein